MTIPIRSVDPSADSPPRVAAGGPAAQQAHRRAPLLVGLLFALPLMYLWAGMVWEGAVKVALGATGQLTPAAIVHRSYAYSSRRHSRGIQVDDVYLCSYRAGGKTFTLPASRSSTSARAGAPSAAYFAFAPDWKARIVFPGESLVSDGGGELLMAGLLALFFGPMLWLLMHGSSPSKETPAAKAASPRPLPRR